ncbi:hypothetical protein HMPREF1155_0733 [Slackia sp. CM382]|nr:hypothetical protein HMPREF1155_0733 [Slackia sp. CM382]
MDEYCLCTYGSTVNGAHCVLPHESLDTKRPSSVSYCDCHIQEEAGF